MKRIKRRAGKRLRRVAAWTLLILLGLIPAAILAAVAAAVVLPMAFRFRGSVEFGGEWLFLGVLFCGAYAVCHNLLCNKIFEEG